MLAQVYAVGRELRNRGAHRKARFPAIVSGMKISTLLKRALCSSGLFFVVACAGLSVRDEGTIPALFGKDVISSTLEEYRPSFTPDGRTIYFARSRAFFPVSRRSTILVSHWENGMWSPPQVASFSGTWPDIDPFVTRDGNRIYFASIRPVDGRERSDSDLWYVERRGDSWSDPIHLGAVNSPHDELYPSIAPDGTLYFGSDRPGGRGGWDIWRSFPGKDHRYGPAINLNNLNSAAWEFNPAISPDGRYLVFTSIGRTENVGMGDLYVSWKNGPNWSVAVHLNPWVNSPADDYHPSFSPDGQLLYFIRRQSPATGGDIYAVPWSLVQP